MRSFIRHPSDIPISYDFDGSTPVCTECLKNVSKGGLCFCTSNPVAKGTGINIHIPISDPVFEAVGVVAWCKKMEEDFLIGVQFAEEATEFSVRMVEQICQIEHFRHQILKHEGRHLTGEEAASEWIKLKAAKFPQ